MTGEYLGMRTRKGASDGEYVIAELFFDVDYKIQMNPVQRSSEW